MQALRYATLIACGIMGVGELVFNLFPSPLLWMFNPSEEMLRLGIPALRTISLCFLPAAVGIVFSTFFQAVGSGGKSLMVSMLRQLVILMPVAYLLSWSEGILSGMRFRLRRCSRSVRAFCS